VVNKREIGREYEGKACHYLESKGFRIVARNFRCRQGEIDIIGYDGEYLVFLEVKYRARSSSGHPAEAVTAAKQKKICRTADYYRYIHGIGDGCAVRYDVVAIMGTGTKADIMWYRNAFYHVHHYGQ